MWTTVTARRKSLQQLYQSMTYVTDTMECSSLVYQIHMHMLTTVTARRKSLQQLYQSMYIRHRYYGVLKSSVSDTYAHVNYSHSQEEIIPVVVSVYILHTGNWSQLLGAFESRRKPLQQLHVIYKSEGHSYSSRKTYSRRNQSSM